MFHGGIEHYGSNVAIGNIRGQHLSFIKYSENIGVSPWHRTFTGGDNRHQVQGRDILRQLITGIIFKSRQKALSGTRQIGMFMIYQPQVRY